MTKIKLYLPQYSAVYLMSSCLLHSTEWHATEEGRKDMVMLVVVILLANQDRNVGVMHDIVTDAAQQSASDGAHSP